MISTIKLKIQLIEAENKKIVRYKKVKSINLRIKQSNSIDEVPNFLSNNLYTKSLMYF